MAQQPNHVPSADPTNTYYTNNAYAHDGSAHNNGQPNAFDGSWQQYPAERLDLVPETEFWQTPDPSNLNNHTTPYYQHAGYDHHNTFPGTGGFAPFDRPSFDPAALQSPSTSNQPPFRPQSTQGNPTVQQVGTIAPNVLEANPAPAPAQTSNTATATKPHIVALVPLPSGNPTNGRFVLTKFDDLKKVANVKSLNAFTDLGQEPVAEIARSTIPAYNPRRSRNEIRTLLASDSKLSASINKKTSRKLGALTVTKKPIRLDATGQFAGRRASSTESSSDEESEYESSEEEEEPSPLPPRRPDTSTGAIEYDSIKALWRPRSKIVSSTEIRSGLTSFWETIKTIRERWNSDRTAVKEAEETKKVNELPMLKERVAKQREMLEIALTTAVKHGHPDIVKHFGENLAMMGALAIFLQERVKESDYNGSFSMSVLQLLVHCTKLTEGNLEKSNIGKILSRYIKRGDANIKALTKKIYENASAATRANSEALKAAASAPASVKDSKASETPSTRQVPAVAGVKRERVADATNTQPLKKVAPENANLNSLHKDTSPTKPASTSASSTHAAKPKTNAVAPKASGFFSLQSASKRPGTSLTSQSLTPKTATASIIPPKKPTASTSTTVPASNEQKAFSVFSFIEESKKPEAKPKAKSEEKRAPETAEEKEKRERKEKRRQLRVHWKPESALVEVRLFSHDPDEELGHDASQYPALTAVDFTDLREQEPDQFGMLFEPYGGGLKKPESLNRTIQEKREAEVLAVYYNSNDLLPPPNPQEPIEDVVPNDGEPQAFGQAPAQVTSRLAVTEAPKMTQPAFDLAAILGSIGGQPSAPQPSAASALDQALSQLRGGSQPTLQALQHPQQSQQPAPQPSTYDLASILGSIGNQPGPTQQPPPPPLAPGPTSDLAAILQGLQSTPHMPQIPGMPSLSDFMAQGGFPIGTVSGQQANGGGQNYPYENEDRKRWREQPSFDGNNDDRELEGDKYSNKRQKWNSNKNHERRGKSPPKYVVECTFFQEGCAVTTFRVHGLFNS
ncbi:hypothetical protein FH972_022475 [Carpinus fangiana]|uniref:Uncharacterized protein n=1 Tax=Carpinus fangiana TaxID=176857 RepID=A0A5N6KSD1_9ROSI|nr:hypothetical protein FH972_022475 [Carpinus fangiana]